MLQLEKEPWLWSQDDQEVFLDWFSFVKRDLKVTKDVSQRHTLLVQSKLLTNAIPKDQERKFRHLR